MGIREISKRIRLGERVPMGYETEDEVPVYFCVEPEHAFGRTDCPRVIQGKVFGMKSRKKHGFYYGCIGKEPCNYTPTRT